MSRALFADFAAAHGFQRRILLWLDGLPRSDQPVDPGQVLVGNLLDRHAPQVTRSSGLRCAPCQVPYPCQTVISAAVTARMPIEWSGSDLAAHLAAIDPACRWDDDAEKFVMYGDPMRSFARRPDGCWDGTQSQRGKVGPQWTSISDEEMVARVLEWSEIRSYPYQHVVDPGDVEWVRDRLGAGRRRWAATPLGAAHEDRRARWRDIPWADPLDGTGWNDLGRAVLDDDVPAARRAVGSGADPEGFDPEGRRPLDLCARFGSIRVARYLLDEVGVTVGATTRRGGLTALDAAVSAAAHDPAGDALVALLIEHGADPDARRESGETPRRLAARLAADPQHFRDVRPLLGPPAPGS